MSAPADFILAARNAGRDITNPEARAAAGRAALELSQPIGTDRATCELCKAIRAALAACPDLPMGTRGPVAVALQHLARALDVLHRRNAVKTDLRLVEESRVPYRPGIED